MTLFMDKNNLTQKKTNYMKKFLRTVFKNCYTEQLTK